VVGSEITSDVDNTWSVSLGDGDGDLDLVDEIEIQALVEKYKGWGTSADPPRMMLKVLVYAYVERICSSRQIEKALRENVNFLWLSGMNRPDHRTINGFRWERMKGAIETVFASVVDVLMETGYIEQENYDVDGTKIEANANKHRVVRAKCNLNKTTPSTL
jgi:transposase